MPPSPLDLEHLQHASGQWIGARAEQQDCLGIFPLARNEILYILADGMGGHAAGRLAAETVVSRFGEAFEKSSNLEDASIRLLSALHSANTALQHILKANQITLSGTTLLAVHIYGRNMRWVSVGDSPLFLWRNTSFQRLNQDHSLREETEHMQQQGRLSAKEAARRRPLLQSAVTGEKIELIDLQTTDVVLQPSDIIIIASDGFEPWLDRQLANHKPSPTSTAHTIVETMTDTLKSLNIPHQDNASAIVIRMVEEIGLANKTLPYRLI